MKCRIAATDPFFLASADPAHLLKDFKFDIDIEFSTDGDLLRQVFFADNVIDSRSNAWSQKVITQFFADDDVFTAAAREEIHAPCDFTVGEKRRPRHCVVPISIDAAKGKDGDESVGPETLHRDSGSKSVRQPNERTDSVPEIVARRKTRNIRFESFGKSQSRMIGLDRCHGKTSLNADDSIDFSEIIPMAKLGICSWSLRPVDAMNLAKRVVALGIPRVQLALVPCVNQPAWRGAVDVLRGEGVEIISGMLAMAGEDYSTLESIAQTGGVRCDARWGENLDRAFRVADLAEQTGIHLVTLHGGFLPHASGDPVRRTMLDRLRTIADIFGQRGIGIALETGQESAATLAHALRELDRPSVGVNFDPANMILYGMGEPLQAIETLAPWLRQVHIKDAVPTKIPGTWGTEVPVGTGSVPWRAFLASVGGIRIGGAGIDLIIERESGACRDEDIVCARDLVCDLVPTLA